MPTGIKQYLQLVNIPEDVNDSSDDFNIIKEQLELKDKKVLVEKDETLKCSLKSFEEILEQLNIDQISRNLLITGSKKHSITGIKIDFIKESINNKHTLKEIGEFLNTSQSAISKMLSYYNIPLY